MLPYTNKQNFALLIPILMVGAFFLTFRLGTDMFNDDGHFWFQRSLRFTEALKTQQWSDTFVNTKPGVTVTWLSGLSLDTFLRVYSAKFGFRPELYTAETFSWVHLAAKLPLVLVTIVFFGLFYLLVKRLFDEWLALFATIFLVTEPYFLGVSRWLHVEGLLTIFITLSALFFLVYLNEGRASTRLLLMSSLTGGLALLTKTPAVLLLPYVAFVLLTDQLLRVDKGELRVSQGLKIWGIWVLGAVLTFVILSPAMWVEPVEVVSRIIGETIHVAEVGRNNWQGPLFYFSALTFRLSPFTLFFSLLGLVLSAGMYTKLKLKQKKLTVWLITFVVSYLVMMSLSSQKIERYLLPIFPFLAVSSAFGIYWLVDKALPRVRKEFLVVTTIIILGFFTLWYSPNFATFYNPFLGGRNVAEKLYGVESVGEMGYEVGEWVNNHENPKDLIVVTTYLTQSLRPFVAGKVFSIDEEIPDEWSVDYVVVPWHHELPGKFRECPLEKTVSFHSDEYWRIYDCVGRLIL